MISVCHSGVRKTLTLNIYVQFELGTVELRRVHPIERAKLLTKIFAFCCQRQSELTERLSKVESANVRLAKERDEAVTKASKAVEAKREFEDTMFSQVCTTVDEFSRKLINRFDR